MKYIVCVGDGMADYPVDVLENATPLQFANTPNMDKVAGLGRCGLAYNIDRKSTSGSDIANFSILGYDCRKKYCGRAAIQAASQGIELTDTQIAVRCNLVTIFDGVMADDSAGNISSEESKALIDALNEQIDVPGVKFCFGSGAKHLLIIDESVLNQNLRRVKYKRPYDVVGQNIDSNMPTGHKSDVLCGLIKKSSEILRNHEINLIKTDLQEKPANSIWLWSAATRPVFESFEKKYGLKGSMITAVNLLKGIAGLIGLDLIDVPGATGYFDTNYELKADYAVRSLADNDFVYVHVEAPDEASRSGSVTEKIKAIENFDSKVVGRILSKLEDLNEDWRIMVICDQVAPVSLKTHVVDPVPFAIMGKDIAKDSIMVYNERSVKKGAYRGKDGFKIMSLFLKK